MVCSVVQSCSHGLFSLWCFLLLCSVEQSCVLNGLFSVTVMFWNGSFIMLLSVLRPCLLIAHLVQWSCVVIVHFIYVAAPGCSDDHIPADWTSHWVTYPLHHVQKSSHQSCQGGKEDCDEDSWFVRWHWTSRNSGKVLSESFHTHRFELNILFPLGHCGREKPRAKAEKNQEMILNLMPCFCNLFLSPKIFHSLITNQKKQGLLFNVGLTFVKAADQRHMAKVCLASENFF